MPFLAPPPPPPPPQCPPSSTIPTSTFARESTASRTKSSSSGLAATQSAMSTDSKIATAKMDVDRISDAMAARLATCLLGHVLYLKSQVPFPIAQLSRMAGGRRDPHSAKKLDNMLSSFDLVSSHLNSTFTSLSTALSLNKKKFPIIASDESTSPSQPNPQRRRKPAKVHMMFVLGPTITSAPAMRGRVMLEIDGLEVRNFGERDDVPLEEEGDVVSDVSSSSPPGSENVPSRSHSKSNSLSSLSSSSGTSSSGQRVPLSELSTTSSTPDNEELCDNEGEGDEQADEGRDEGVPDSDSEESSEEEEDEEDEEEETPVPDPRYDEATLLAADRMLSRTLAIANADPEKGMAAEISPTQIHVLLRAPRRFTHPTWLPKQNIGKVMDGILSAYEEDSKPNSTSGDGAEKGEKRRAGKWRVKTDGVRVSCRGAEEDTEAGTAVCKEGEEDEEDEMIWWCWDGKLEGLSEL